MTMSFSIIKIYFEKIKLTTKDKVLKFLKHVSTEIIK